MRYQKPCLESIDADCAVAGCCTLFIPPITILDKIYISGTCVIRIG